MDFCMAATMSTGLGNDNSLSRTACDSELFRRSSARHLSLPIWSSVLTSRSTCQRAQHQSFSGLGRDQTVLGFVARDVTCVVVVAVVVLWLRHHAHE